MKKIKYSVLIFILSCIILMNLNSLAFATMSNLEIIVPDTVNFGEKFSVSLKVPENTYGIEATVILKYSDGAEETQKLVYVNGGIGGTENLVTFVAKVGGKAQITVTDIILCDASANPIETEKTIVTTINIKKDITKIKIVNPLVESTDDNSSYICEFGKEENLCFNLYAYPIDATQIGEIKWTSSNENIIKIEKNIDENLSTPSYNIPGFGMAKCIDSVKICILNPGKTTITATCGNLTDIYEINVVDSNNIVDTTLEVKDFTINSEKKKAIFLNQKKLVKDILIEENFPIIISNEIKIFDENGNEKVLTDKVGSKNILKIMDSQNNILSEYTIVVLGDVTGDGEVKMYDAFQILKETLFSVNNLSELDILIRDFNGDGIVKMYDAFSFLKYSLFN